MVGVNSLTSAVIVETSQVYNILVAVLTFVFLILSVSLFATNYAVLKKNTVGHEALIGYNQFMLAFGKHCINYLFHIYYILCIKIEHFKTTI